MWKEDSTHHVPPQLSKGENSPDFKANPIGEREARPTRDWFARSDDSGWQRLLQGRGSGRKRKKVAGLALGGRSSDDGRRLLISVL